MRVFPRVIALTGLMAAGLAICPQIAEAKVSVVTTTQDLAAIAREVAGSRATVVALAPGDRDPHMVEPRPSWVMHLRKADVLVRVGMDLDVWVQALVDAARNARIAYGGPGYVDASTGIRKLEVPTVKVDPSMGHIHIYGNPHYWLDPRNGKVIAGSILEALKRVDPAGSEEYQRRYQAFCDRLDQAVSRWRARMKPFQGAQVVVYHRSWSYFNRCFGLRQFGELEPKPGVPPSPAHVNSLITRMKGAQVKVILMEPFYPRRFPEMVARETGAKLVVASPSVGGTKGVASYFDLFDHLVGAVSAALS